MQFIERCAAKLATDVIKTFGHVEGLIQKVNCTQRFIVSTADFSEYRCSERRGNDLLWFRGGLVCKAHKLLYHSTLVMALEQRESSEFGGDLESNKEAGE